jgi:hypothetical protein
MLIVTSYNTVLLPYYHTYPAAQLNNYSVGYQNYGSDIGQAVRESLAESNRQQEEDDLQYALDLSSATARSLKDISSNDFVAQQEALLRNCHPPQATTLPSQIDARSSDQKFARTFLDLIEEINRIDTSTTAGENFQDACVALKDSLAERAISEKTVTHRKQIKYLGRLVRAMNDPASSIENKQVDIQEYSKKAQNLNCSVRAKVERVIASAKKLFSHKKANPSSDTGVPSENRSTTQGFNSTPWLDTALIAKVQSAAADYIHAI